MDYAFFILACYSLSVDNYALCISFGSCEFH